MTTSEGQTGPCPACGEGKIETDIGPGGGVCGECGLVYTDGEWANVSTDSYSEEELSGNSSSVAGWQEDVTIRDAMDKQLVRFLSKIDTVAKELRLSTEARNEAAEVVTEAWNQNLMHGRELNGMVAAGIVISSRRGKELRPISQIVAACDTEEKNMRNAYRGLLIELEIDVKPPSPSGYIPYLSEKLDVSSGVRTRALETIESNSIGGNPAAIAAAAIYSASSPASDDLTLKQAGEAVGVTKETVWRKTESLRS